MRKILQSLLVGVVLVAIPAVSQAATKTSHEAAGEQQVLVLLNEIRADHGLSSFSASIPLRNAARAHSADMLANDYFDHDSPTEAWDARIYRHVKSPLIGENIAWGTGSYGTPDGIVSQWMHSPVHRHIILTAGLHKVGLALTAGTFEGNAGTVMATADFSA
jgi:uncharacterized protein YkwD